MEIKSLLKQYNEVSAKLDAAISKGGKTFLEELFKDIFDQFPHIHKLAYLGWTPSFNDGDLCTHHSEMFAGVRTKSWRDDGTFSFDYDDYGDPSEFFASREEFEEFEEEHAEYIAGLPEDINGLASDEDLAAAQKQLNAYDEIIQRIYETNYIVTATRLPDGTVYVNQDWYDPGY